MKEIDFLPEWYKNGRRRKITYRTQYVALAGIFAIMVAWNSFTAHSISRAKADLAEVTAEDAEVKNASRTFAQLTSRIGELQKKAALLQEIDSRIDVASVLAELSFLIDNRVVLSRVELTAEKFADEGSQRKLKRPGARP